MAKLDWVRPYLAVGPRPMSKFDWEALQREKVTLIIDLNDSPLEKEDSRAFKISHKGLRVPEPPEQEELLRTFSTIHEWIEDERKSGGKVYLHCTAGQQRSPTCAMAHLIAGGETVEGAKKLVMSARLGVWGGPVNIKTLERALHLWKSKLEA